MKNFGLVCANVTFATVEAVKSNILVVFMEAFYLPNTKGSLCPLFQ